MRDRARDGRDARSVYPGLGEPDFDTPGLTHHPPRRGLLRWVVVSRTAALGLLLGVVAAGSATAGAGVATGGAGVTPAAGAGVENAGAEIATAGAGVPVSTGAPTRWQDDPIWNDGKAEVSVYSATETKYGSPREFLAYFIVVAEDLRNDTLVKSDDPRPASGLTRVLKMNQVYDIRTGIYSYRQMASIFLRVSDLALVKESVTSHEWCGNTFLLLENRDGKGTLRGFSYFDGEAEKSQSLDLTGAVLYDSLPLWVRSIPLRAGESRPLRLVSQILGNRLLPTRVGEARLAVAGPETVTAPIGAMKAWKVEVTHADGTDRLWVEAAAPNRLVLWEQFDGGRYRLERAKRLAYWTLHDLGDEDALEEETPGGEPDPKLGLEKRRAPAARPQERPR